MVDAIVSIAVERLGDCLVQEARFWHGVKGEVEWLKDQLGMMRASVKDAENKQISDERICVWITRVRNLAYDAEDVLDTFILKVKVNELGGGRGRWLHSLTKRFSISRMVALYNIGKKIEALKIQMEGIDSDRVRYDIKSIDNAQDSSSGANEILLHLRRTTPADEDVFIGMEDDIRVLKSKLLLTEPRRHVISIWGMGGLGKTTLAKRLYNNIKGSFDYHTWVCVSQEWTPRALLERIRKSLKELTTEEMEKLKLMNDEDLEQDIRKLLEERRYLVVIDDIWDKKAWESMRRGLPDNEKGSRIIITTRNEEVAELSNQRTYVHKLPFLKPGESWKLFCNKAFDNGNANNAVRSCCPSNLEVIGREMVAKCNGLPLAIVVLGGLLYFKKGDEWPLVREHIWQEVKEETDRISLILSLSFNDLPQHLKPCFLYLGLYPEDFTIKACKLIVLWIAEGFIIQGKEKLEPEDVAEKYLKELSKRSLIQVTQRSSWKFATCQVHDLLRDLAVEKARELNFISIYDGNSISAPSSLDRRLGVHSGFERYVECDYSNPLLRTLLFCGEVNRTDGKHATVICERHKLLRVLHLEGVCFDFRRNEFSDGIGKLIHLRHLSLEDTLMNKLPGWLGNLHALQTLITPRHDCLKITWELCELKQLRHIRGLFRLGKQPKLIGNLTNLQTLVTLTISSGTSKEMQVVMESIGNLRNLRILSLDYENVVVPILPLSRCQHLKYLKLKFTSGNFQQDPFQTLGMLPKLKVLILDYVSEGKIVTFTARSFPSLEALIINFEIRRVEKVVMEEGAMPRLRALSVRPDITHDTLPERLRSLPDAQYEWYAAFN